MIDWVRQNLVLIVIALVAVGGWWALRSTATPAAGFERALAGETPVVLQFFGNT